MADKHSTGPKPLPQLTERDIQRFRSKVDKTPGQGPRGKCWTWKGTLTQGYGAFKISHRRSNRSRQMVKAHRIAYFLAYGVDPFPLLVCHTCDYPPCIRSEHLFKGTTQDNTADMIAKGRKPVGDNHPFRVHPESRPIGERNGHAVLNANDVLAIRAAARDGETDHSIKARYPVTIENIRQILSYRSWKHIA